MELPSRPQISYNIYGEVILSYRFLGKGEAVWEEEKTFNPWGLMVVFFSGIKILEQDQSQLLANSTDGEWIYIRFPNQTKTYGKQ